MVFGDWIADAGRYLDGGLDEVGIWLDKALSDTELNQLYNAGAGLAYPFGAAPAPDTSARYTITVTDFFNSTALAGVNVSLSGTCDNVTDASGIAILTNKTPGCSAVEGGETATLTLAPYYFNESTYSISENASADAGAFQLRRNVSVNRVWDGAAIATPYTIEAGGQNYSNGSDVYLRNGSSTVQFYKPGWYVHTVSLSETEPLDGLANVTGAYNQLLNLTAQNAFSAAFLASFNITTFALPFNTTSTELFLNSTQNTTYEIAVDSVGYQGERVNVTTAGALVHNYSFQLWSANSVRVNIFDQDSGLTITENISVTVSGNSSEDTFDTTTGFLFVSNLTDGSYTFKLQNENYTLVSYPVVVAANSSQVLNAYLSKSTGTVTFTILDFDSSAVIEGANIDMERQINASWTLVANKLSDITGRAQFPYTPAVQYRFTVTASGYTGKEFILDPILFSSYNIRLERTATVPEDEDYAGVVVSWSPTWYEANVTSNFSITFSSPEGLLTAYNFTLSYPGGSLSGSGSNVYGGTISPGAVPLGAAMAYDTVNLTYIYDTSIGDEREFSVQYVINGIVEVDSLEDLKDNTFGLGLLERVLIASLVVLMVGGVLASFTGALGALAGIVLIQGVMVSTGFLPLWSILPGVLVAVVYIMRRSGA